MVFPPHKLILPWAAFAPLSPRSGPQLRAMVEPLCKTHGIPYRSTTLWEGTCEVLQHLAEVTTEIVTEFPAM